MQGESTCRLWVTLRTRWNLFSSFLLIRPSSP